MLFQLTMLMETLAMAPTLIALCHLPGVSGHRYGKSLAPVRRKEELHRFQQKGANICTN